MPLSLTRRGFLKTSAAAGLATLALPAISRAASRPVVTHGVQSGDVDASSGMIWARADRPSRMLVEVATGESFRDARQLAPINALPEDDLVAKRLLENLPADQDIFYRVRFADLSDVNAISEPIVGHFRTAPASRRSVKFVWSGDTAGQGFGIDESRGGMLTYATMLQHAPDFLLHSGDSVYCDNPIPPEVTLTDGLWKNIVAEGVEKVAETLDEFRGRFKYNLLDPNVRAFNAAVPTFHQWDDHEVMNNWSPSKSVLDDDRYSEKSIALLAARAGRAFHEMTPIRYVPAEPGRIYRHVAYGPLLDVFFLDLRSYRGDNDANLGDGPDAGRLLGREQSEWLKAALTSSRGLWKVIACDKSIGFVDWADHRDRSQEGVANADDGPPLGREIEFAEVLRFLRDSGIRNVVWLTADVHYTAAHRYDPGRAAFQEFEPFWEFISGPLHAGSFGPGVLDQTFGPEVIFYKAPPADGPQNLPPSAGLQFFGIVEIEGESGVMTVRLMDRDDTELFTQTLEPQGLV